MRIGKIGLGGGHVKTTPPQSIEFDGFGFGGFLSTAQNRMDDIICRRPSAWLTNDRQIIRFFLIQVDSNGGTCPALENHHFEASDSGA